MRWLVTGAGGMLGRELTGVLRRLTADATVRAADRACLDVTDRAAVHAAVPGHDVVVNAAAWTNVDGAESSEGAATEVNGLGPRWLAEACAASGAVLVHVSTDYVFDGAASSPYQEYATTAPVNAYGRSKLAGEHAVLELLPQAGYVVRTGWLYGWHRSNVVSTMIGRAAGGALVEVIDDQRGQPTWTRPLAMQLLALAGRALAGDAPAGIYHGTCAGEATWHGLIAEAFRCCGLEPSLARPIPAARLRRPAPRPAYSVLGHARWAAAGLEPMPDWRDAIRLALAGER